MKITSKFWFITLMIGVAAISRILPHPYNFTPLVAISLFGGANFEKKWQAYLIPLLAYLFSDLVLNMIGIKGFYGVTQLFVYGGMILVAALGTTMHTAKTVKVLGYSFSGSAIFWLVSNFGVWFANGITSGPTHEAGLTLGMTYLRALPFYNQFSNQLFLGQFAGDLFYCIVLFGIFGLAQKKLPLLKYSKA
ncbi:DUF6580 family putative transport protein [Niabella soli]|uniref:Uncharacterized protein n=1 Tax=Niabella soli DSM 19437 TaxID=929713 RepID=W0F0G0_9BACT|nr:DUF6580 family putative transport protein [Niabella soli]AHF16540.1 hypothetical protein NIASO_17935 [Niabella soli DSM 19437]